MRRIERQTALLCGMILLLMAATAVPAAVSAPGRWNGMDWSWWEKHQVKDFDQLRLVERRSADFTVGSFGMNASSFYGQRIAENLFAGIYFNTLSAPVRRYFSDPYPGYSNQRIGWTSLAPSLKYYLPFPYVRLPFVLRPYVTAGMTASLGYQLPSFFGDSRVQLPVGGNIGERDLGYQSSNGFGYGLFTGGGADIHLTRTVRLNLDYKYSTLAFAKMLGNRIDWSHHRWAIGISYSFLRNQGQRMQQPVMINRTPPVLRPEDRP